MLIFCCHRGTIKVETMLNCPRCRFESENIDKDVVREHIDGSAEVMMPPWYMLAEFKNCVLMEREITVASDAVGIIGGAIFHPKNFEAPQPFVRRLSDCGAFCWRSSGIDPR